MLLIASVLENTLKLIGLFIVFILIIIACYFVTRLVGRQQMGFQRKTNFKILDSMRVSQNNSLMIVKVGKKFFCIGVSKDKVSKICELSDEDFDDFSSETTASFSNVFSSALKKKNNTEEPVTEEDKEN